MEERTRAAWIDAFVRLAFLKPSYHPQIRCLTSLHPLVVLWNAAHVDWALEYAGGVPRPAGPRISMSSANVGQCKHAPHRYENCASDSSTDSRGPAEVWSDSVAHPASPIWSASRPDLEHCLDRSRVAGESHHLPKRASGRKTGRKEANAMNQCAGAGCYLGGKKPTWDWALEPVQPFGILDLTLVGDSVTADPQ
jgi:hypothetical protein